MKQNYIIFLPPSEGKVSGGDETKSFRFVSNLKKNNQFITLQIDRDFLYQNLKKEISESSPKELESIFELKGKNLDEYVFKMHDLLNQPTMKAIERYKGTMFKYLSYETLSENDKVNFNNSVVFIDGLFGLLKPEDLIPDYKLKISTKFGNFSVTDFWKERAKGVIGSLCKNKISIDLLPSTHRKIMSYNEGDVYYSVNFGKMKNSTFVNEGHNSKKLKGEFIRYIVKEKNISRKYIEEFIHSEGFKYNETLSTETEIYFTK